MLVCPVHFLRVDVAVMAVFVAMLSHIILTNHNHQPLSVVFSVTNFVPGTLLQSWHHTMETH